MKSGPHAGAAAAGLAGAGKKYRPWIDFTGTVYFEGRRRLPAPASYLFLPLLLH